MDTFRRDKRLLLLTGRPGSGKTTLLQRAAERLADRRIAGFYTAELRGRHGREGFELCTFDGHRARMAHVGFPKTHRVGRYGVDPGALEAFVGAALAADAGAQAYLVDEIGKMECLSSRFVGAMEALLGSGAPVVATVAQRGAGFIAEVKRRADAEIREVTPANRDALPEEVAAWVRARCP